MNVYVNIPIQHSIRYFWIYKCESLTVIDNFTLLTMNGKFVKLKAFKKYVRNKIITNTTHVNYKIDKDVQQILLPLSTFQMLTFNPKYRIKNNVLQPNDYLNKFITSSGAIMFVTSLIYRLLEIFLDDNFKRYGTIHFLFFASIFDFIFRFSGFIMNLIINFIYTNTSVLFILHLQEVHRFLNNVASSRRFIIRSWTSVGATVGYYIVIAVYMYLVLLKPPWNIVLNFCLLMTLDSNVVYAIRSMTLLTDKVVLWNEQLLMLRENGCAKEQSKKMFQSYVQILKCYKIITIIYQLPVSDNCDLVRLNFIFIYLVFLQIFKGFLCCVWLTTCILLTCLHTSFYNCRASSLV